MKIRTFLALLLILGGACAPQQIQPTITPTLPPTNTSSPTDTPTPEPTPTSTPTLVPTSTPTVVSWLGKIKIATQSPLSGGMSAVGKDIRNGAKLAIEHLSSPLNAMGFEVELAPYDDKGDPYVGIENATEIVADPEILCVIGHYNSGIQIPSSEVYHAANLVNISPANTNPLVTTRGYLEVNRVLGRDDMQGIAGAQFAKAKGIQSVYIMYEESAYGLNLAKMFRQEATNLGIKTLGFTLTKEMSNFKVILSTVLPKRPDLIYFAGMYDQISEFIKQARENGYLGMFLSGDGFDSWDSARIAGDALTQGAGTYYTTVSGPASVYPGTAQFISDFRERFSHDPQPFAAQAYDAAAICLKAIENAAKANENQTPDRLSAAQAVRSIIDFPGITGTINFNQNGDLTLAKYFIIRVSASDPEVWAYNPIDQTFDIAPPE